MSWLCKLGLHNWFTWKATWTHRVCLRHGCTKAQRLVFYSDRTQEWIDE